MGKLQGIRTEKIALNQLETGEVLVGTLLDEKGHVLLNKGRPITEALLDRLRARGMEYVFLEIVEEREEASVASHDISWETKQKTLDDLQNVVKSLIEVKPTTIEPLERDIHTIVEEVRAHQEIVIPIVQLKKHDDFTFTHSLNVAIIATFIGKFLGLKETEIALLGLGALLHDLGKLSIPPEILRKSTALTQEEFQIIQKHPLTAKKILDQQTHLNDWAKIIALQHHEKIDGSGYPFHLGEEAISIFSQITAVADIYEALTSDRPYRKALPISEVVEYLMGNSGYKLSERVVLAFVSHLSPYQVGDVVRLSNGKEAVVSRFNPVLPFRPFVQIREYLPDGKLILSPEIDLSQSLVLTIVEEITLQSQVRLP